MYGLCVTHLKFVMKQIIDFLEALRENNNRDWFHAHKNEYQESRDRFFEIIEQIINSVVTTDTRLQSVSPKDTVFRINRDIRFSKDKSPYKTHYGSYIARGGRKSGDAGYYFHVSPDEVFLGGGVYQPEKEPLHIIRQEILFQPDTYKSIVASMEKDGFSLIEDDKLKTGPKGFDKDSPDINLIKYKHYFLSKRLTKAQINSPDIATIAADYFISLFPFTDFLNTAMEFTGND